MKKLKLNKTAFAGAEVLSRAQLKNVLGGDGSGGGQYSCWCDSGSGGFSPISSATTDELLQMIDEYCGGSSANCEPI